MCYLVREPAAEPERGSAGAPSGSPGARSRWAAAGAMALAGGLALAALVTPTAVRHESVPKHVAPPATPVATVERATPAPETLLRLELSAAGVDDGVTTTPEMLKAAAGAGCSESL